jgi:hypothetical protein
MTTSRPEIPKIDTDEFWLKYLSPGMFIEVPVTGHHKKNGQAEDKRWCANSLALRDLHPNIYDVIIEREGVFIYFDFNEIGRVRYNLGLDIPARKIAKENDNEEYSSLSDEKIENSVVQMIYVGSKKVREDTPEQKKRKMDGQRARRAEQHEQTLKTSGHTGHTGHIVNGDETKKEKKEKVKSYSRAKRRRSRWDL